MKSFFLNFIANLPNLIATLIIFLISLAFISFMDHLLGWELKAGFAGLISSIFTEIVIINSKLNDILESRKTDNYYDGVGIK